MLPKTPQSSQFKTPYRAPTSTSISPPATWSHCPDLIQATTPSLTITCSQVSTPGITVNDLQAIAKKSSGRHGSKAGFSNKPDNGHLIKKQTIPKPITYRQSMKQSKMKMSSVTSSPNGRGIGSPAETVLSGETHTHSEVDVAIGCLDDISQKAHCCPGAGEGVSNSSAAVDAIGQNNKPGYREKLHSVRNSLPQAAMKKRKQEALAKDVRVKRPKHVAKDTVRTKTVLDKYFKTYAHCTISGHSPKKNDLKKSHRETDQIVLVNQDDYVYRDPDCPPGRMRDAYDFIPSSPEKKVAQATRVSENKKKEQVRLQVLKTIYSIETELAVLRHRRKQIKDRLTRATSSPAGSQRSKSSLSRIQRQETHIPRKTFIDKEHRREDCGDPGTALGPRPLYTQPRQRSSMGLLPGNTAQSNQPRTFLTILRLPNTSAFCITQIVRGAVLPVENPDTLLICQAIRRYQTKGTKNNGEPDDSVLGMQARHFKGEHCREGEALGKRTWFRDCETDYNHAETIYSHCYNAFVVTRQGNVIYSNDKFILCLICELLLSVLKEASSAALTSSDRSTEGDGYRCNLWDIQ